MSAFPPLPRRPVDDQAHGVRLVHTSDMHIGWESYRNAEQDSALTMLAALPRVVAGETAHMVLIAGDFFDNNRVDEQLVIAVGEILGRVGVPVVILPGNHDPLTPDSIYLRFPHHFPPNVHFIRAAEGELLSFPEIGVQVWGQAHTAYEDFHPAAAPPRWSDPSDRPTWRVALAHGSSVGSDRRPDFGYRIEHHHLVALDAHYVALGHLELRGDAGPDEVTAYYSGSPHRSGGFAVGSILRRRGCRCALPCMAATPNRDRFSPCVDAR